jgi:hypothetical protein
MGLRALQPLAARMRQRAHGAVEAQARELLGLSGAWAETGTPEQALGLRLAEGPAVNGRRHLFVIGAIAPGVER